MPSLVAIFAVPPLTKTHRRTATLLPHTGGRRWPRAHHPPCGWFADQRQRLTQPLRPAGVRTSVTTRTALDAQTAASRRSFTESRFGRICGMCLPSWRPATSSLGRPPGRITTICCWLRRWTCPRCRRSPFPAFDRSTTLVGLWSPACVQKRSGAPGTRSAKHASSGQPAASPGGPMLAGVVHGCVLDG